MSKKITYEFVKEQFEKEGYELLSKEYVNAHIKLKYRCPEGHEHSIIWNKWQQGKRCPYCYGNVKLDVEFIKLEFKKEGYILLTTKYINNRQKLDYICPNGHKHFICWGDWWAGVRCLYCSGKAKKSIEFIRSEFEKENYTLLTTEYINSKQELEYVCSKGHRHSISWGGWSSGHRCPYCAVIKNSGKGHYNWKNYSKTDLEEISAYKVCVWQLTNHNYRKCKNIINPLDLSRKRKKYSLDHIYSIADGFRNSVPAEILASPINLQILPYYENIVKRTRSDISLNELYTNYNKELNNEL